MNPLDRCLNLLVFVVLVLYSLDYSTLERKEKVMALVCRRSLSFRYRYLVVRMDTYSSCLLVGLFCVCCERTEPPTMDGCVIPRDTGKYVVLRTVSTVCLWILDTACLSVCTKYYVFCTQYPRVDLLVFALPSFFFRTVPRFLWKENRNPSLERKSEFWWK
jgi:hypothetical protein